MKNIKRIGLMMVIMIGAVLLTGCGEKNIEGNLDEIMTKLYANVEEDQMPMSLETIEISDDNIIGFLGTRDIEYESAVASEPMISSIAHSVILVRTKENADVEAIKTKIKENINPRKWVCVWVEDDEVIIENKGDLIIVIMVQSEEVRNAIYEGFKNLK